ncbi:hypothetical protein [Nitrosomonas sp. Is37]|uniref:hypothetical protein n=1 Tax=Nitrosomonas sp. Is37 TaxID=3080535 RepID=UPI00294B9810|nr:hypothetical protein [Nitrosomonas sp. Is37]MDV6344542.1 hypothetical protein [Nitrosomonas sp. Is37]
MGELAHHFERKDSRQKNWFTVNALSPMRLYINLACDHRRMLPRRFLPWKTVKVIKLCHTVTSMDFNGEKKMKSGETTYRG